VSQKYNFVKTKPQLCAASYTEGGSATNCTLNSSAGSCLRWPFATSQSRD